MSEQTYGTENLKKILSTTFKTFSKIEDAKADDDKVSVIESISIAISLVPDVYGIARNGKNILNEYKDLDDSERDELIIWFTDEFDIDDEAVEEKIEAIFEWLLATDELISVLF